jgi:hypothetical protein
MIPKFESRSNINHQEVEILLKGRERKAMFDYVKNGSTFII